jgi:hypothetical protein
MGFQEARSPACLFHQLRLADQFKIDQFDQVFPPRHENEPRQWESFINSARHSGKSPDGARMPRKPIVENEGH